MWSEHGFLVPPVYSEPFREEFEGLSPFKHPIRVGCAARCRRTPHPLTKWNSSLLIAMSMTLIYSLNDY
jgi:hypothetical protein